MKLKFWNKRLSFDSIMAQFTTAIAQLETFRKELVSQALDTDIKIAELRNKADSLEAEIERVDSVSDNLKSLIDGKNG